MKKLLLSLVVTGYCSLATVHCLYATPSTQIWNPSTDIQTVKTMHLGIDNYFSVSANDTKPSALPTDVNLTYGLCPNLEVGIDVFEPEKLPSTNPLFYNAKYGIPESDKMPFAAAVGGLNFGGTPNVDNMNILYGIVAKNIGKVGRLSLGYYSGNDKVLLDDKGAIANTGAIVSFDKQISDKVWAALDYASGNNIYGNFSFGGSYLFAPNTSVIFGYVMYNNTILNPNNQVTTQLDINF